MDDLFYVNDCFAVHLADLEDTAGKKKPVIPIQVLKVGNFIHPVLGRFSLSEKDFDLFIKNFEAKVYKTRPAVNLNHKREEAAAWFTKLEKRNGGRELWGLVELTDSGFEALKKGEFRYVSAEISFTWKDNETGQLHSRVLTGAAFTNYPFIQGMDAVELEDPRFSKTNKKTERNPNMDLEQIKQACKALGIDFEALQRSGADLSVIKADLEATKSALATEKKEHETAKSALAKAQADLEVVKKKQGDIEFEAIVKKGMQEGRLTKAFADSQLRVIYDAQGADFTQKMVAEMPKTVSTETSGSSDNREEKTKDAELEVHEKAKELMAKKDGIDFSEAVSRVLQANPDLETRMEAEMAAQANG